MSDDESTYVAPSEDGRSVPPEPTILMTCPDCDGDGDEECPECSGTGEGDSCDECDGDGVDEDGVDCIGCNGNGAYDCEGTDCGEAGVGRITCTRCDGQGEIETKES